MLAFYLNVSRYIDSSSPLLIGVWTQTVLCVRSTWTCVFVSLLGFNSSWRCWCFDCLHLICIPTRTRLSQELCFRKGNKTVFEVSYEHLLNLNIPSVGKSRLPAVQVSMGGSDVFGFIVLPPPSVSTLKLQSAVPFDLSGASELLVLQRACVSITNECL